jgi:hypothetical protein
MYISILDFASGKVIIRCVDDSVDAEDYVSERYGLDSTGYMTTMELDLDISTHKDI